MNNNTNRARHLRQVFVSLNMQPINRPEVIVAFTDEKIEDNGRVMDGKTMTKIRQLLAALVK